MLGLWLTNSNHSSQPVYVNEMVITHCQFLVIGYIVYSRKWNPVVEKKKKNSLLENAVCWGFLLHRETNLKDRRLFDTS